MTGVSGLADMAVDTDEQALDAIKRFLSYLPSHTWNRRPCIRCRAGSGTRRAGRFSRSCRNRATKVYDVRKIVARGRRQRLSLSS